MDSVATQTLKRMVAGPIPALVLSLLLLTALLLLSFAAQNEARLADIFAPLLIVNLAGIALLFILSLASLVKLVRQVRAHVIGSRLTLRIVLMFTLLAFLPLSAVYYISIQFLSRGIDSWFDVRIEQAMEDAVLLGQVSLKSLKESQVETLRLYVPELASMSENLEIIRLLELVRRDEGYRETSLFRQNGQIIASSSADSGTLLPDQPTGQVFSAVQASGVYAERETGLDGSGILRMVIPVPSLQVGGGLRYLQAIKPIPLRFANLEQSINTAIGEYDRLVYLRGPLKFSFILTLSLVSLMTLLLAVWMATYAARRLAAPLEELAEGTKAVADGDYSKRLPVKSNDELGILIRSFNRMTTQISRARENAIISRRKLADQHTYLETVLEHLSSGVLSFNTDQRLRTFNSRAGEILGIEQLSTLSEQHIDILGEQHDGLSDLFTTFKAVMRGEQKEWQREITLFASQGRQVLLCRGTQLPGEDENSYGYVFVFDDVTTLIQAQRDAAWGEVARRLAHEIKNPLTPIQLSAERIRHKYLKQLGDNDTQTLDRATRTISEQVESMKDMVNAFSNYAQPVTMNLGNVDLNRLISDVVELHRDHTKSVEFNLSLDALLPQMMIDSGRMRQVFNNLIGNALQAVQNNPDARLNISTEITTDRDGSTKIARITITDNGPGIAENILEKVFEPYITNKEKGTGLGLAIVKKIIEEHGGAIWANNITDNGARMTFKLPIRSTT
ncbi:MAG TPA: two-component sensor histidine kinase [Gammaproteobacteria bacterium]|nr:two-component sensor histidine kinase [Gammaproteobacteria bacterium]